MKRRRIPSSTRKALGPAPLPPAQAARLQTGHPSILDVAGQRYAVVSELLNSAVFPYSVDFVHDLRVATRRLTEVVRLLGDTLDGQVGQAINDALRETRQAAGELRDLDVMVEHLGSPTFLPAVPPVLLPIVQHVAGQLAAQRATLLARLQAHLQSPPPRGAMILLARLLEIQQDNVGKTARALDKTLRERISRRRQQLRQAMGEAAARQTPSAFHHARIAVKKLRYSLELAHEAGLADKVRQSGRPHELGFLKDLQTHLGDMHDTDVLVKRLREEVRAKHTWPEPLEKPLREAAHTLFAALAQTQAKRAADYFAQAFLWVNRQLPK